MTKFFDKFFHSILESTSFLDLPDKKPYGFWISPSGEFFVVDEMYAHEIVGREIIKKTPSLEQQFSPDAEVTVFLGKNKYIRVASLSKNSKEYLADLFFDENNKIIPFTPTNASLKTAKDLATFYNCKITFFNS